MQLELEIQAGITLLIKNDHITHQRLQIQRLQAELRFLGGETEEGLKQLKEQVKKRKNESVPLARLAWCHFLNGDLDNAKTRFEELREVAIGADRSVEVFARLDSLIEAIGVEADWVISEGGKKGDVHFRPTLDSLGPVHWTPPEVPHWELADADNEVAPESHRSRTTQKSHTEKVAQSGSIKPKMISPA